MEWAKSENVPALQQRIKKVELEGRADRVAAAPIALLLRRSRAH